MTDTRPQWQRIFDELKTGIVDGTWPVGTTLPSRAATEHEHGVSRTVVDRAWRELREQGLIESAQGRGMIVVATQTDADRYRSLEDRITALEAKAGLIDEISAQVAELQRRLDP